MSKACSLTYNIQTKQISISRNVMSDEGMETPKIVGATCALQLEEEDELQPQRISIILPILQLIQQLQQQATAQALLQHFPDQTYNSTNSCHN